MHPQVLLTLIMLFPVTLISAQRAGYAGARPSGLSQKDKYHGSGPNGTISFSERFGEPVVNEIAFGASQRPPVGYPIVAPQASYVPLATAVVSDAPTQEQSLTPSFANRIGGADDQPPVADGGAKAIPEPGAAIATGTQLVVQQPQTLPMPLDAGGDQTLIAQLSALPEDKRPFWFLNWQAIEAQRNGTGSNFSGAIASRGSFFG